MFDPDRNNDFIEDADAAERDWLKTKDNGVNELKKAGLFHPKYWKAKDFEEYFEENKKKYGASVAWELLYDQILRRDEEIEYVEADGMLFVKNPQRR